MVLGDLGSRVSSAKRLWSRVEKLGPWGAVNQVQGYTGAQLCPKYHCQTGLWACCGQAEASGMCLEVPTPPRLEATYRHSNLPQNVLWNRHVFIKNLTVELVQGCVHEFHADPHISLWVDARRLAQAHLGLHLCLDSLPGASSGQASGRHICPSLSPEIY